MSPSVTSENTHNHPLTGYFPPTFSEADIFAERNFHHLAPIPIVLKCLRFQICHNHPLEDDLGLIKLLLIVPL